jgi:hypothetical protein
MAQARKKPVAKMEEAFELPEGYSFVKDEALEAMIASQREAAANANTVQREAAAGIHATEERWANTLKLSSTQTEQMFAGLQVATRAMGDEIARLTLRNVEQDRKVLDYQTEIHKRNQQISEMERQSEEARLKREDQAHQLKAKELDIQSKAMELAADKAKFQQTLELISPLVMAGGMGLKDWIFEKMAANKGGAAPSPGPVPSNQGGGLPGPSNGHTPGTNGAGQAPRYRVKMDHINEWRQFTALAFANIKPETAALLRALIAGGFSSDASPKMPIADVIAAFRADLGEEALFGFMRLTGAGWEEVEPQAPQAAPSAN